MSLLEDQARSVELAHGVVIASFYDPPYSFRDDAPAPVRRWRVRLPSWFDTGSWLHGEHSFTSLDVALTALQESGTLDAIDAYHEATAAARRARQTAFSKIMAAYNHTDKSYTDMLHERQRAQRARLNALQSS